jgi:hypothetical protein
MCLPTSLKTYPPKQVAISQNGAFPDYYRWEWYEALEVAFKSRCSTQRTLAMQKSAVSALIPSATTWQKLDHFFGRHFQKKLYA